MSRQSRFVPLVILGGLLASSAMAAGHPPKPLEGNYLSILYMMARVLETSEKGFAYEEYLDGYTVVSRGRPLPRDEFERRGLRDRKLEEFRAAVRRLPADQRVEIVGEVELQSYDFDARSFPLRWVSYNYMGRGMPPAQSVGPGRFAAAAQAGHTRGGGYVIHGLPRRFELDCGKSAHERLSNLDVAESEARDLRAGGTTLFTSAVVRVVAAPPRETSKLWPHLPPGKDNLRTDPIQKLECEVESVSFYRDEEREYLVRRISIGG